MLTTLFTLYTAVVGFLLLIFLLTTIMNLFVFPKLGVPSPVPQLMGTLSILIPARNEGAIIYDTVRRLLNQTLGTFELILLDDESEDNTAVLAQKAAQDDPRLKIISGQPLPDGWLGKNWACHQLSQAASGDWLLFTDADVQYKPQALAALITQQQQQQADLLTIWPTQITGSWSEKFVIPLMKFAIMSYLPHVGVNELPWPIFAAANGQCMLLRRPMYEAIGGHEAVRGEIVEDVHLARRIKGQGFRLRMVDGGGLVSCRMYDGWTAVRHGFGKNILAGHGHSVAFLLLSTLVHWSLFVFPWVWLVLGGGWLAVGLLTLGWLNRLLTGLFVGRGVFNALVEAWLMPLSVGLMTVVVGQALWWHHGRGPEWKGRIAQT